MCPDASAFEQMEPWSGSVAIGQGSLAIKGKGVISLKLSKECGGTTLKLADVFYIPDLKFRLISVRKMAQKGINVNFTANEAVGVDNIGVVFKAFQSGGLYHLNSASPEAAVAVNHANCDGVALVSVWHERLGHLHEKALRQIPGLEEEKVGSEACDICCQGKLVRKGFHIHSDRKSSKPLELIHSDVVGKITPASNGKASFFVTFLDDHSNYLKVCCVAQKSEVFGEFVKFKREVENQFDLKIKKFQSDFGTEYCHKEFKELFEESGIIHRRSAPGCPEQQGKAERVNRTIIEMARCLMIRSGVPLSFWGEAVSTACYIRNRCPSRAINGRIPLELWEGRRFTVADIEDLKVFGCKVWIGVDPQNKFLCKSVEGVFVGYQENVKKGYRVWDLKKGKVYIRHEANLIFVETVFPFQQANIVADNVTKWLVDDQSEDGVDSDDQNGEPEVQGEVLGNVDNGEQFEVREELPNADFGGQVEVREAGGPDDAAVEMMGNRRYPLRVRQPRVFPNFICYVSQFKNDPTTVKEALNSEERNEWIMAMKEEYESLVANQTYELVDRPCDANVVPCKWVFKTKRDQNGVPVSYRARLVAKGFKQIHGLDYDEVFSPVCRKDTFRILVALSATLGVDLEHLDFKAAFLNGILEEKVYMCQPDNFVKSGEERKVCLLKRSIYGLKQASRVWNLQIHAELCALGFQQSENDSCLYYIHSAGGLTVLTLYVDDLLLLSTQNSERQRVKDALRSKFQLKDLGVVELFLGVHVSRDERGNLYLDQNHYIRELLEKFGLTEANPCKTPMDINGELIINEKKEANLSVPYQSLVGSLLFIANCTRPDISHAVGVLSQFNSNYTDEHYFKAERVLRYLKGTMHLKLKFEKLNEKAFELLGFVDADWGGDKSDSCSYTGYLFQLGGSSVSWGSRKQKSVALSTTEAEYMALSDSAREGVSLLWLLKEIQGDDVSDCLVMYNDNQGAVKLSKNSGYHPKTKHIRLRYHFVRQLVDEGTVRVLYMPTEEMLADILTKPLCRVKHERLIKSLKLTG